MHMAATTRAGASIRAFALSVGLAAMLGGAASTATRDEEFSPAGAGPLRRAASSAAIARLSARP
jgi:hypothetical protein